MEPERWREIERLYHLTREEEPGRRAAILEQNCRGDEELRQEVEALLKHGEKAAGYVDAAVRAVAVHARDLPTIPLPGQGNGPEPGEIAGSVIGRYCLARKVGEGGMGEVWLAEQQAPVRRQVALKLVKPGMSTRDVMARFESERQALALMEHPAIAKVFDAGTTPRGTPYFVMEYVAGVPITAYCDSHQLTIRQRLELFMRVCEGVQHAHQKAIIHRDLKPSNILVMEVDGRAVPKIIDFGIAKALTQKLTAETMLTSVGALMGTPEDMSPEQADWSRDDIDTRTDVYSLGVIFYQLLSGVPPLQMRKLAFEEFLRRLREEEPPKPSARLRALDEAAALEMAVRRRSDARALAREIRGDLGSIALKALEKDRSRRYGSPSDFASDIGRYLRNEAVFAVPPSAAYRARKFARRYRAAIAPAGAFVLVLILAAAISIWQSVRATRQRDRADAETAVAQAVNDFLQNDLLAQASVNKQAGRSVTGDPDLKVRTALDRAAARIAGKFDRQPEVEAAIRDTIGQTYTDLGLYAAAQKQLERALALEHRVFGKENPKALKTASRIGWIAFLQGNEKEAETLLRQVLETQRRVAGPEHPDTLETMNSLGNVFTTEGKYAQAESLIGRALEIRRRVLGPEHHDTLDSMNDLARFYESEGKYAQSAILLAETFEIMRRVLGPEHPETLAVMNNLAIMCDEQGKYAEAETLFAQTVEMMRQVLGPEHRTTLETMVQLGEAYYQQDKYAPAVPLLKRTLRIQRRLFGAEDADTLDTLSSIASMYQRQGKYALAASYAAQALAGLKKAAGPEDADTMDAAADLALAYESEGQFPASESLAREAVEIDRQKRPDDWRRYRAESLLGASLAGERRYADAEGLLIEGYQGMAERKDSFPVPDWYHVDLARHWIVQLYQAWGKPEQAAEWRRK